MGQSTSAEIPKTMKRLVLVERNADITKVKIEMEEVDVPVPKSGQVLIRVCAAPVNPSDYGIWKRPGKEEENKEEKTQKSIPMGKEGSGIVVASGGGLVASRMVGKSVGFVQLPRGQGAYSEFVTAVAMTSVFPLPNNVPVEDACSFFVNPFTAYGIYETALARGSQGCVHTAAASQLGQMLVKFTRDFPNFHLINVVRRQEQADLLKGIGAKHVVVTGGNDNWKKEVKALMDEHKVSAAFDCISGEMTGDLTTLLPNKGSYFTYGGLSGQPCSGINPIDMIYRNVRVEGFFLPTWLAGTGKVSMLRRLNAASNAVLPCLKDGWSMSQFIDCSMENMFEKFVELWNTGFTNKKLRIRMIDPTIAAKIQDAVASEKPVVEEEPKTAQAEADGPTEDAEAAPCAE